MKTIGILGGMGPRATADFNQRIISICQEKYKAKKDSDFPPIIIYEVPLKGFDETGIKDSKKVLNSLKKGIRTLEEGKVDFIVIDCNTVHLYIDELRKITKKPIISILEEVYKKTKKYKILGLLASQTTVNKQIYEKVFKNKKIIHPNKEQEKIITSTILNVMAGENSKKDYEKLKKIIQFFIEKEAQAIIIGCTELSIPLRNKKFKIPLIDSTECLANVAIEKSLKTRDSKI